MVAGATNALPGDLFEGMKGSKWEGSSGDGVEWSWTDVDEGRAVIPCYIVRLTRRRPTGHADVPGSPGSAGIFLPVGAD